eukprot:3288928-Rhodomonas_salina.1
MARHGLGSKSAEMQRRSHANNGKCQTHLPPHPTDVCATPTRAINVCDVLPARLPATTCEPSHRS